MVRTLSFQLKNVGSIPSNLKIFEFNSLNTRLNNFDTLINIKQLFFYSFTFYSLFPLNYNLLNTAIILNQIKIKKKLYIKQFYLLLTWLNYLTFWKIYYKITNITSKLKFAFPTFAILPIKSKFYSFQKAPMAHKTWSFEQYQFLFYQLKIQLFFSNFFLNYKLTINESLLLLLLIKKYFPLFESNLLFLKQYYIIFNFLLKLI